MKKKTTRLARAVPHVRAGGKSIVASTALALLAACSGAGGGSDAGVDTLKPGDSMTVRSGMTLHVPPPTTAGNVTIVGHHTMVSVGSGTVVHVDPAASGAADNVIVTK